MNNFITLDYELFFGPKSGTPEKCILEPTRALLKILDPHNIKFTAFVDSGYLLALQRQAGDYPELQDDFNRIASQLRDLGNQGHGIELHVHPHWEDSFYDGKKWVIESTRYKLADFSPNEVIDIVSRYNDILKSIVGYAPVAYRAGGWCVQPFPPIGTALAKNNIYIDSTVYPNGYYRSSNQHFDFRNAPAYCTKYSFSEDPVRPETGGQFMEIPISSIRLSPIFFWRFAFLRLSGYKQHLAYGDGAAIGMSRKEMVRLLTRPSYSVVSIDGYKVSFLEKAFRNYKKATQDQGNFVMIGHPKSFTPYSLDKLRKFIERHQKNHNYMTYRNIASATS